MSKPTTIKDKVDFFKDAVGVEGILELLPTYMFDELFSQAYEMYGPTEDDND